MKKIPENLVTLYQKINIVFITKHEMVSSCGLKAGKPLVQIKFPTRNLLSDSYKIACKIGLKDV
jgi:hypothetical protein